MANVKAADICTILKKLAQTGDERLEAFYARLAPESAKRVRSALPISWVPLEVEAETIRAAGAILFPDLDESAAARRLGQETAETNFSGVYRVFIMIPTFAFILKGTAQAWRTLCDQGEIRVEHLTKRGAEMVCVGLPELSPIHREFIAGYDLGVLSLLKRNARVTLDESNPEAWRWRLSWD